MKKLTYLFLCMIILGSCNLTKKNTNTNDNVYGVSVQTMQQLSIDTFSIYQVDSMVKVDKLPNKNKWETTYLKDGETNIAYEYKTLYDKSSKTIYTLKYLKDKKLYVVKKRSISTK